MPIAQPHLESFEFRTGEVLVEHNFFAQLWLKTATCWATATPVLRDCNNLAVPFNPPHLYLRMSQRIASKAFVHPVVTASRVGTAHTALYSSSQLVERVGSSFTSS